jgi:hypothetical protein
MAKLLPAKTLFTQAAHFNITTYNEIVDGFTIEELLEPTTWRHHASKFKQGDLLFVMAADGSYDIALRVSAVMRDGVKVHLWPFVGEGETAREPAPVEQKMIDGEPVPRVEFTRATKWRGIGIGGDEVFRDVASKAEAQKLLEDYARAHNVKLAA